MNLNIYENLLKTSEKISQNNINYNQTFKKYKFFKNKKQKKIDFFHFFQRPSFLS